MPETGSLEENLEKIAALSREGPKASVSETGKILPADLREAAAAEALISEPAAEQDAQISVSAEAAVPAPQSLDIFIDKPRILEQMDKLRDSGKKDLSASQDAASLLKRVILQRQKLENNRN